MVNVSVVGSAASRRKRSASDDPEDIDVNFSMYKCWFANCTPPIPDDEKVPLSDRPDYAEYWDRSGWQPDPENANGVISNSSVGPTELKVQDGNDVTISKGTVVNLPVYTPHKLCSVRRLCCFHCYA